MTTRDEALDWSVPQRCRECERLMRPPAARAASWPGTTQAASMRDDMCRACRRAMERRGVACRPRTALPGSRRPVTVRELMEQGAACVSAPSAEHMAMVRRVTSQW